MDKRFEHILSKDKKLETVYAASLIIMRMQIKKYNQIPVNRYMTRMAKFKVLSQN